ncbi:MAG: M15 family metallopeptidase [Phaeodactylibacter sp.]|nr:M15 family metallopeptidase [Phaeodactylibacter sp.]MCB9290175.1 M15 family metallopeptidase [Lewinellaceae bacterium]
MKTNMAILFLALALTISCQPSRGQEQDAKPGKEDSNEGPGAYSTTLSSLADTAIARGFTLDYVMGHFDPATHPGFTLVDTRFADREGLYLRKDTYEAFLRMYEAAKKDDVTLTIRSATRNFDYQKGIWERKWTGAQAIENGKDASKAYPNPKERALKILEYSSMPGTSRHHWGTDMDLNAFTNKYFETGEGLKIYEWLSAHAAEYGFCQPYSPKGEARPYGYNEEKWHWSFLPIAQPLTALAKEKLKDDMITGFKGAESATEIGVVEKYVLGINPECLP